MIEEDKLAKASGVYEKGEDEKTTTCLLLILPVAAMIAVTIIGMYITGRWEYLKWSRYEIVLWGVLSGLPSRSS